VPQGSPLGPVLFIIYLNDICKGLPNGVEIKLYADDVKIWVVHKNDENVIKLQNTLNKIVSWSNTWRIPINFDKTYVLYLGKWNSYYNYTINLENLKSVKTIKDLGLVYDNKLNFSSYINQIVKIGYYKSLQLCRILKCKNPHIWARAFKIYVRPNLEYASQIWNPYYKNQIDKIEAVQKFFTRRLFTKCRLTYKPYVERLNYLNLQSLQMRRKNIDIITVFKICKGLSNVHSSDIFEFSERRSRKHQLQIKHQHQSNINRNSFTIRNTNIWNNLPSEIINISNIKHLKRSLYRNPELLEIRTRGH